MAHGVLESDLLFDLQSLDLLVLNFLCESYGPGAKPELITGTTRFRPMVWPLWAGFTVKNHNRSQYRGLLRGGVGWGGLTVSIASIGLETLWKL